MAVVATAFAVVVVAAPRRNAPAALFAAAGALVLSLIGWFSLGPGVPVAGIAVAVAALVMTIVDRRAGA